MEYQDACGAIITIYGISVNRRNGTAPIRCNGIDTLLNSVKNCLDNGVHFTAEFLANAALFHCAVLAYNTLRWMAIMSGSQTLRQWEPETIRTYLVRVAGKLLTGNRQLTVKTPDNHLYPQAWNDWVAVGLGS